MPGTPIPAERAGRVGGLRPLTVRGWTVGDDHYEVHAGQPILLPKHFHDGYQIALSTRSVGKYHCDGKQVQADPGSLMVVYPGEVHWTESPDERIGRVGSRLVYVPTARLQRLAKDLGHPACSEHPVLRSRVSTDPDVIRRFIAAHDLSRGDETTLAKDQALLSFLEILLNRQGVGAQPEAAVKRDSKRVRMARDFIEAHFAEDISLARLADACASSPHHLNRRFAGELGMPPHAFQNNVRISRAKRLLLDGVAAMEVALLTGFYDHSHFIRRFRQMVGVTPTSYVQQVRG